MDFWCMNSAWRVWPSTRIREDNSNVMHLHVAKGGHAYGQILLRGVKDFTILGADINREKVDSDIEMSMLLQGYEIFNDGMPYPDKLLPLKECSVLAHYTQGMWLQIAVPTHIAAGKTTFEVTIRTSEGEFTAYVELVVYDVVLPTPAEGALDHEYFYETLNTEAYGQQWERGSKQWWTMMESSAKRMKELRINVFNITLTALLSGGSKRVDKLHWEFDFSFLDELVTKFMSWGSFRNIIIHAPLHVVKGDKVFALDEKGDIIDLMTRSEEGEAFIHELLYAVKQHFEEKGWLSMTMMHLVDEPHESENWLWLRGLVRQYMPEVPCCEPIDEYHSALELEGECNIFVPREDVYDEGPEYFKRRQKMGDKLWCYTCCLPEDIWWLNKLIEQPAVYSRLLYWGCYSQGITGFLHWGFNWWWTDHGGLKPQVRHKGDGYIIYPDIETGGVLLSNRAIATVQGTEEYELLKIAERRYPQAAMALAKRLVRTFKDFCEEPDIVEYIRIQLLQLCEM